MTAEHRRDRTPWRAATVLSDDPPVDLDDFLRGRLSRPQPTMPALSLFSNTGVGDYGYRLAGFTFHVHAELVPERLGLCKNNHPRSALVEGDLRTTWPQVVEAYQERCREPPALLTAMPPCQGMSSGSNSERAGKTNDDQRNTLAFVVAEVAAKLKPQFVVVENVPGILYTRVKDPDSGEEGFVAQLLAAKMRGYRAYACTIQFADYGIPQRRLRTIITFVRKNTEAAENLERADRYPFPRPTNSRRPVPGRKRWTTVKDFLEELDLAPLSAAPTGRHRDDEDPLHFVPRLDERRFKWVATIPAHSGRSAFENGCLECGMKEIALHRMMCPSCGSALLARPHVGEGSSVRKIIGHLSSYRRMRSDMPSTTITTATGHLGSDANIHPWENRLLSPRECALLQTVPWSLDWTTADGTPPPVTHLRAMIGEALPPWYGYLHGVALRVAAGVRGHAALLPKHAAEAQRLDYRDLEDIQADRRKRLEAARRTRPERRLDEIAAR